MSDENMTGVQTAPLYENDPMDVVVHKIQWQAGHSTGQVAEFEHPRKKARNFVNVDAHVTEGAEIETFSCGTGTINFSFGGGLGSNVSVWIPVGMADALALAVLGEAAKYRADAQDRAEAQA
jgi:hypothetical protein